MRGALCFVAALCSPVAADALTWTRVLEIPVTDVYSVQLQGTTVYAGTAETVWIGTNFGSSWSETASCNPGAAGVESVIFAGGALWAGTFGQGVFRSVNGGTSWQSVNTGLSGLGALYISDFVEKSGFLYASTVGAGVYRLDLSTPTGWSSFNAGYPVDTAGNVDAFVLHGTTLVAGAGANGFTFRFPQGASAWQTVPIVPPNQPGLQPIDLCSNGADLYVSTSGRVYRSSNDGQSWTETSTGIATIGDTYLAATGPVLFAAVDFLGSNQRLYRSADRGNSWVLTDQIAAYVYGMQAVKDKLFAARTDGLWWGQLAPSDLEPVPLPHAPRLAQNVPNPFNPTTRIAFELPEADVVTLEVHTVSGRRVVTLLERTPYGAGTHSVPFVAPDLASGIYFYVLRTDRATLARKMTLLR